MVGAHLATMELTTYTVMCDSITNNIAVHVTTAVTLRVQAAIVHPPNTAFDAQAQVTQFGASITLSSL